MIDLVIVKGSSRSQSPCCYGYSRSTSFKTGSGLTDAFISLNLKSRILNLSKRQVCKADHKKKSDGFGISSMSDAGGCPWATRAIKI